jgi:tRNA uracil 4-sulfurtransferase
MYLVRYSEIALKSEPVRRRWEDILITNIHKALPGCKVKKERGRIWVDGEVDPEKLKKVFGIVSFSEVEHCELKDLSPFLIDYCRRSGLGQAETFALRVKRVGNHSFKSQDKTIELADLILGEFTNLKVNLGSPEMTIHIEIRNAECYLFTGAVKGAGGLPLGVEGTLVALFSGGIDSPVAAWMMMKRGCKIVPVYADLFGSQSALKRAEAVIEVLKQYQPDLELMVVRDRFLEDAKEKLARDGMLKYTCLICKRRMYAVAESVARDVGAKGIVTGESLGQVASQTLDNLFVLDAAATMPVYRPLIGFDKVDAEKIAREIGTFEPSIMPASGCSAVPHKPSTKAKLGLIKEIEEMLARPEAPV